MKVGLIGAGAMATALARGWGEPVIVADPAAERAEALAAETGGSVAPSHGRRTCRTPPLAAATTTLTMFTGMAKPMPMEPPERE